MLEPSCSPKSPQGGKGLDFEATMDKLRLRVVTPVSAAPIQSSPCDTLCRLPDILCCTMRSLQLALLVYALSCPTRPGPLRSYTSRHSPLPTKSAILYPVQYRNSYRNNNNEHTNATPGFYLDLLKPFGCTCRRPASRNSNPEMMSALAQPSPAKQ